MRTMFFFNNRSAARYCLVAFLLALPLSWAGAQDDDVYFVPKKKDKTSQTQSNRNNVQIIYVDDEDNASEPIYTTNPRDVDEYNRRSKTKRGYTLPGSDTLYVMSDSTIVTTRSLANDVYSYGYDEGFSDGQDYAYSQRLSRFGYSSIYASPWYFHCYDPWYYDPWYYDPYWYGGYYGYYGRPYWSLSWGWGGYYGGYYGWHHPHHYYDRGYGHGGHPRGDFVDRGGHNGHRPGSTGRTTVGSGRGGRGSNGSGYIIGGDSRSRGYSYGGTRTRGADGLYNSSGARSGNRAETGGVRSSTGGTYSGGGRSSGGTYSGGSTRSSSGSSGSFGGGGRSSGGGGGRSGGGGGRSGGGGRGGR